MTAMRGESVLSEFISRFGQKPMLYRAPARMNIIGEHTDYNEGFVLPSTVDLYTWAAAAPRNDRLVNVHLCHENRTHEIRLDRIARGESGRAVEYLKGVVWALQEGGLEPRGCNVVIAGNIPIGGGLSSSASLELALAFALVEPPAAEADRARLARLCQRAESEFVGVQCGIMDQFAITLGERGHAMILDCRSLEFEQLRLPENARFVVVHSGVSHRLPSGEYNSRRNECKEAVIRLSERNPGLQSLRDLDWNGLESGRDRLGDRLFRRCRHVLTENRRVAEAREAIRGNDIERLGSLMRKSHRSLRDDYQVSCPELDRLVEIADSGKGVLGSRMMGGGFGGCTITLVEPDAVDGFTALIRREYGRELGREPWMHVAGPASAVSRLGD